MKKVFVIVIMLAYGLSSSGMTISLHYCCGKLDDISLSPRASKPCKMGNHFKKSGCCTDKQISTKTTAEQEQGTKCLQVSKLVIATPASNVGLHNILSNIVLISTLARGRPVPLSPVPIYIKNCAFRV